MVTFEQLLSSKAVPSDYRKLSLKKLADRTVYIEDLEQSRAEDVNLNNKFVLPRDVLWVAFSESNNSILSATEELFYIYNPEGAHYTVYKLNKNKDRLLPVNQEKLSAIIGTKIERRSNNMATNIEKLTEQIKNEDEKLQAGAGLDPVAKNETFTEGEGSEPQLTEEEIKAQKEAKREAQKRLRDRKAKELQEIVAVDNKVDEDTSEYQQIVHIHNKKFSRLVGYTVNSAEKTAFSFNKASVKVDGNLVMADNLTASEQAQFKAKPIAKLAQKEIIVKVKRKAAQGINGLILSFPQSGMKTPNDMVTEKNREDIKELEDSFKQPQVMKTILATKAQAVYLTSLLSGGQIKEHESTHPNNADTVKLGMEYVVVSERDKDTNQVTTKRVERSFLRKENKSPLINETNFFPKKVVLEKGINQLTDKERVDIQKGIFEKLFVADDKITKYSMLKPEFKTMITKDEKSGNITTEYLKAGGRGISVVNPYNEQEIPTPAVTVYMETSNKEGKIRLKEVGYDNIGGKSFPKADIAEAVALDSFKNPRYSTIIRVADGALTRDSLANFYSSQSSNNNNSSRQQVVGLEAISVMERVAKIGNVDRDASIQGLNIAEIQKTIVEKSRM